MENRWERGSQEAVDKHARGRLRADVMVKT